ncbi:MAG: glycoside hydrolase family 5 protein [Treponema sp.]|nr:glycoside hydrolase family 5 protein [Treponema sp.]
MKNAARVLPAVLIILSAGCGTGADRPGAQDPGEISGRTAFEFFREEGLTIGWNLGNTLDAVRTWGAGAPVAEEAAWGNPPANRAIFEGIRGQGFNLVRIPVTWAGHVGPAPDYAISPARLERVAEVVGFAKDAGLKVIINMHHDGRTYTEGDQPGTWLSLLRAGTDPTARAQITGQFGRMWEQIAGRFADHGEWLIFQGFNELHVGDWGTGLNRPVEFGIINEWNQVFTDAVRGAGGLNRYRFLIHSGYNTSFQTVTAFNNGMFRLPNDPSPGRQIVNFHFYQPTDFALFRENHVWPPATDHGSIAGINAVFAGFRETFVDRGIPVIIGEMGPVRHGASSHGGNAAYVETARQNRLSYASQVYAIARENGLVPIYWDNGSFDGAGERFGLFNRANGRPNSEESHGVIRAMLDAAKR